VKDNKIINSIILILIIIGIPILGVVIIDEFNLKNVWIGYIGAYIGALISGMVMIYVLWRTTEQTRKIQYNNKIDSVKPMLVVDGNNTLIKGIADESKYVQIPKLLNVGNGATHHIDIKFSNELNKNNPYAFVVEKGGYKASINIYSDIMYDYDLDHIIEMSINYKDIYGNKYSTIYRLGMRVDSFYASNMKYLD